jgi:hypothetical protein
MTLEEIQELNPIRPYCQETEGEENWYRIGLVDGLDAVSEIWHGQQERPAYDKYILVLSDGNGVNNGLSTYYLDNWHGIKAWCYLDDILKTIPDNLMYKDVRRKYKPQTTERI